MYVAITLIALFLLILMVILFRKQLFYDEHNAKILVMVFVFLPIMVIGIVVAAFM